MITLAITNTSGTDIVAGDGVLPNALNWLAIADTATASAVIQVHDLDRVENNHSGFTMGDLLQQLKQYGVCTYDMTDAGDTEDNGSVVDHAVATAA
ncbi:MAG: hypothetical protein ACYTFU_06990 [Planctomycetota bacterium]|jgi:hypothetical protein